jgi:hypothetical protein
MVRAYKRLIFPVALLLTLGLMACGGGDGDAPAAATTTETTQAAAATETTTTTEGRSVVTGSGQFTTADSPQLEAVKEQTEALAETVPEGASITGDQAIETVQEWLKDRSVFCGNWAARPGWRTKYFGDGTWEVAVSGDYDPWAADATRGAVKPRLWRIEDDSNIMVASLNENFPC